MQTVDRKAQLAEAIEELERARVGGLGELKELENSLDAHRRDLATLGEQRERCCELEAIEGRSNLSAIDSKIATSSARARGFERLAEAKRHRITAINAELGPLAQELNGIKHEEFVAQALAEIAEQQVIGLRDIARRDALVTGFVSRMTKLRAVQGDERVTRAASQVAYELSRLWDGMRP